MKKFLIKVFLFLIPIILFFTLPYTILKGTKENFTNINSALISEKPYLIGYAYNENNYGYLKWYSIENIKKQEIWALGSSRVLQFRSKMFQKPFYNAGYTISKVGDFEPFLKSISKEKYPNYIILGLDQWMFNAHWDQGENFKNQNYWKNSFTSSPKSSIYTKVYKDILNQKYDLSVINAKDSISKIGLNARVNNKGFRNDGSMLYGSQIEKLLADNEKANDYKFNDTYKRIQNGNRRFEYADSLNPIALNQLKELLKICKQNNIEIIGFCPPFAPSVLEEMISTKRYDYLNQLNAELNLIFSEQDYEFYDYTFTKQLNSQDSEFIDGFHGSEVIYGRILADMLGNESELNSVVSLNDLKNDLINKKNRYSIYE